jgi:hypothetical protein
VEQARRIFSANIFVEISQFIFYLIVFQLHLIRDQGFLNGNVDGNKPEKND